MAFEFKETLQISFPDIDESLGIVESTKTDKATKGLIVEVAAIHVGATANFNYYTEEALEGSVPSWTEPYGKPIILNHDPFSESVGRVIGARMDTGADGTPFVRLQAAITDPDAIQKVKDKRYLTGSVGGKADEARCTICDSDWAAKEARGPACAHRKGKVYEGKVAFLKLQKVKFHEYSWVNMPADENSQVLSMAESDIGKCFILDLDNDTPTVETFDGEERVNVLSEMKKKEALPIYMGLKGSFLTAVALQESENPTNLTKDIENTDSNNTNTDSNKISEENFMSNTSEKNEDVDLLDIVEGLEEDADKEETPTSTDTPEDNDDDDASSDDEAKNEGDEDAPEGEDDPKDDDDDAEETAEGTDEDEDGDKEETPDATDSDEDSEEENDSEDDSTDKDDEDSDDDNKSEEESDSQLVDEGEADEVSESKDDDDLTSDELNERITQLEEENARLRKAVHRMLAERVVDAKISVGIEVGDRAEAIKEHSERTAASLADSIRDLSSLTAKVSETEEDESETIAKPEKLESEVAASEDEKGASFEDEDETDELHESESPEDFFVDAFMGRKPL